MAFQGAPTSFCDDALLKNPFAYQGGLFNNVYFPPPPPMNFFSFVMSSNLHPHLNVPKDVAANMQTNACFMNNIQSGSRGYQPNVGGEKEDWNQEHSMMGSHDAKQINYGKDLPKVRALNIVFWIFTNEVMLPGPVARDCVKKIIVARGGSK